MLILAIVVVGLSAGWAAHLLVGQGRASWGQLFAVGIAGSFVGGMLGSLIFGDGIQLRMSGVVGSILGAVLVLLVMRLVGQRSGPAHR